MVVTITRDDLKQERSHLDINDVDLEDLHNYLNVHLWAASVNVITFEDDRTGMTRDIKNRWARTDYKYFKTKIEDYGDFEYTFTCYPNTEPIKIGDIYIFFAAGIADVQICDSESIKDEVNGTRMEPTSPMDLTSTFWQNCYKIMDMDFPIEKLREEL